MTAPLEKWQLAWLRSRDNPLLFVTDVLGVPEFKDDPDDPNCPGLETWQRGALIAVGEHDRVSIRSGHGVGKTTFIAWLALWFLLTHKDCKVPIAANSQDQLRDTIWPEIRKWAKRLPDALARQIEVTAERVVVVASPEEAFAVARTASKDNPEALQGFHALFLLFLIDEAGGIDNVVFEVAQGALSTPGAKAVMTGNPNRNSGFFYDTHHVLRHKWHTMVVSSEDVARARGHIDDIIAKWGIESNQYRVRVLGEFPTADDDTVIPLNTVLASVCRDVVTLDYMPVWGLDVARFGDDRTALAKRQANELLEPVIAWRNMDLMQTVGRLQQEYTATKMDLRPSEILIDVIGIGAGVLDRAREVGLPARGINVGEQASSKETYMRLRDELWFKGREWFEDQTCKIPEGCDDLISELISPTYRVLSTGKMQVEQKDEMKKRGMPSPDLADAFLLTLAGGLMRKVPRDRYNRRHGRKSTSWMAA